MRFLASFLLIIFFIVLSVVVLLSGTIKFQILDYNFWSNTFEKNNVYQSLAASTKNSFESQIGKEGGSKTDAKVLTDLITTANVKDFVNRNLQSVLGFANGKSPEIIVYVPVDKFPKSLLPKNLSGIQSEMSLQDLLTKFNYASYSSLPLKSLSQSAQFSSFIFVGSMATLLVVLIFLILLVEGGRRLISPGVAMALSGLLIILLVKLIESLKSLQAGAQTSSSFIYVLAGTLLPPLLGELTRVWFIVGASLVVLGLILFFVKKPGYNKKIT